MIFQVRVCLPLLSVYMSASLKNVQSEQNCDDPVDGVQGFEEHAGDPPVLAEPECARPGGGIMTVRVKTHSDDCPGGVSASIINPIDQTPAGLLPSYRR
jgi:hypothetical protein